MTLDIAKFISNSIKTQAKVQHLDVSTKTVARNDVPQSVNDLVAKEYGDKYMLDADYVSFFWGPIGKEEIKKLFNVVDKALGKSANKLTETDFKKLSLGEEAEEVEPEDSEEDDEQEEQEKASTEEEIEQEDIDDDDDGDDEEIEELDEDDGSDEAAPEAPKKTSHFFLKITMK